MSSIGNKVLKEWRNVVVKRIVDQAKYQPSSQNFRANGNPSCCDPVALH